MSVGHLAPPPPSTHLRAASEKPQIEVDRPTYLPVKIYWKRRIYIGADVIYSSLCMPDRRRREEEKKKTKQKKEKKKEEEEEEK